MEAIKRDDKKEYSYNYGYLSSAVERLLDETKEGNYRGISHLIEALREAHKTTERNLSSRTNQSNPH